MHSRNCDLYLCDGTRCYMSHDDRAFDVWAQGDGRDAYDEIDTLGEFDFMAIPFEEIELTSAMLAALDKRICAALRPRVRKMHLAQRVNAAKARAEIARRAARLASVKGH